MTDDFFSEIDERRAIVKRLAAQFDAVFVPFPSLFHALAKPGNPEHWTADGVHPTPAGHYNMSPFWREHVPG